MKVFYFLFTLLILNKVEAITTSIKCAPNQMRVWTQTVGFSCVSRLVMQTTDPLCPLWERPLVVNPLVGFPSPLVQPQIVPWWAYEGSLYYPNVNYPGPWQYPGIQQQYYPGQGEIFAAKPNVYIESIHNNKKFNFKFVSEVKPHFLATTPVLDKSLTWSGKISEKDKYEIDGIFYDYLFYDVRLPKEKMQFTNGACMTREAAIQWMMQDLKEMKYSAIALQDFEEHWRVKIPEYPYYCVYPQYNSQLDPILPVEIDIEQNTFMRSLYVLVPHKEEPDMNTEPEIPFPSGDPEEFRPSARIQRENMFREWGVAFLSY